MFQVQARRSGTIRLLMQPFHRMIPNRNLVPPYDDHVSPWFQAAIANGCRESHQETLKVPGTETTTYEPCAFHWPIS